jgi:GDP-L-fucose synthase
MNILLTGGSGFVGKNIYESLREKYKIYAPSSAELDLLDYHKVEEYIRKNRIKVVIHAAVRGGTDVLDSSLRMFFGILRSIDYLDKIIHFGSGAEFAKNRDMKKVKETEIGKFLPVDAYGLAKIMIQQIIHREKKIVNLRLFGIYGKYEGYIYKFISNSIVKNILHQPIKIKQNVIFDYLFIEDLIPIVTYFIENNHKYSSYNITPTKSISLTEIAATINSISTYKSKISVLHKGYNYKYTGNNLRLLKEVKNIKFTSYKNGIKQLYLYYENLRDKLNKSDIIKDAYLKESKLRNR